MVTEAKIPSFVDFDNRWGSNCYVCHRASGSEHGTCYGHAWTWYG